MGETTKIEWADKTFNAWEGCSKVSPACDGCYAEALVAKRFGRVEWGGPGKGAGTRRRTSAGNWRQPIRWNTAAEKAGTRPFVFCASLADVFDNQVDEEWRRDLFDLIRKTPRLVWLLLTKRPQNIVKMAEACGGLPANAAIGATCEDQERADKNVPALLEAKAKLSPAFAFLSCEPLLGPIDLHAWLPGCYECAEECGWRSGEAPNGEVCRNCGIMDPQGFGEFCSACGSADIGDVCPDCEANVVHAHPDTPNLDWLITGGETDQGKHKARPTHPDWFRSLRDQCAAAGVPFLFKQWGEWRHAPDRAHFKETISQPWRRLDSGISGVRPAFIVREGKARSGRSLDGVTHDGFPEIRSA